MADQNAKISINIETNGADKAKKDLTDIANVAPKVAEGAERVEQANNKASNSYKGMGGNIRNSAYQLQDFIVQVQAGTSVTTALSQQLPQLLSGFGMIGVVAGVAAAALGIVINTMDLFSSKLEKAMKAQKTANDEMRKTITIFDQFAEATQIITTKSANYIEDWVIAYKKANAEVKNELKQTLEYEIAIAEVAARAARQSYANLLVRRGLLGQENGPGATDYSGQPRDMAMMTAENALRQTEDFLERLQKLQRGDFSGAAAGGDKQNSLNISLQQRIDAVLAEAKYLGVSNAEREKGVLLAEMQAQASRAGLSLDKQQLDLLGKLIIARDASRSAEKIREYSREQDRVIDLLRLEGSAINRTAFEQKQLVDQRNFEAQLIKDTIGMQPAQKQAYEENARMLFKQRQELERVNHEQSRTFEFGAKKAFRSYLDDLGNVAKATEQLFNNAFKSIEDSMVSAFNTGKLSFKSLVDSIMADITRLVVRQAIMRPIMGAIGMGGGSGSGLGSLLGAGFSYFGASGIGTALTYGTNIGSQQTAMLAAQDAAFLSEGTNEVPYDNFPAILHKGEAVVPAKYNPAVGGQSGEMSVTYSPIINIDSRTDATQVRQLVVSAVQQGQMDLVDKINRGQVRIRQ